MSEPVHDYIGVVGSVREALAERVKALQSCQGVQRELNKSMETKVKTKLTGKQDRVNTLRQEITENKRQVDWSRIMKVISQKNKMDIDWTLIG